MKKNIYSGENFKWLKIHIDELLLTTTVTKGTDSLKWKLIFLSIHYLKSETNMTYKKACVLISEKELKKLIEYNDVLINKDEVKIPLADKNWDRFIQHKKNSSKGGKITQLKNEEEAIDNEHLNETDEEESELPF